MPLDAQFLYFFFQIIIKKNSFIKSKTQALQKKVLFSDCINSINKNFTLLIFKNEN